MMHIRALHRAIGSSTQYRRPLTLHSTGMASGASAVAASRSVVQLDATTAPNVLDNIDCILFDMDGVLWTGSQQIYNAPESLRVLRARGKKLLFVTNNASKSRATYVTKLKSMGLDVAAEEIVSASYAAAAYLSSTGAFKKGDPNGKVALVLANSGVEQELDTAGVAWVGGEVWHPPQLLTPDAMCALPLDSRIGAVVVGWDPNFNYSRLVYGATCLRELPGCAFIATNGDHADNIGRRTVDPSVGAPLPGTPASSATSEPSASSIASSSAAGQVACSSSTPAATNLMRMMPGTGCMVAAMQVASDRDPLIVGKGGPWLLPFLTRLYNLQPSRTAIVGDRLDTDIALGRDGGLCTFLPLTGVTTVEAALAADEHSAPDYVIPSVAALAGLPSQPSS